MRSKESIVRERLPPDCKDCIAVTAYFEANPDVSSRLATRAIGASMGRNCKGFDSDNQLCRSTGPLSAYQGETIADSPADS